MGTDDGPADRQPHAQSAGLCGVESLENALDMFRIDARSGIANRDEDAISLSPFGADQQLPRPCLDRAHCFDGVQYQVQDDLLQLNTIPLYGEQPLSKARMNQDPVLGDRASPQYDHLIDRVIETKAGLSRGRSPDVITDPVDDLSGSIGVGHDTGKRFPDLAQLGRLPVQKIHGRSGVVARGGDRLHDFVGQRGGLFSHDPEAIHVREIGLQLAQSLVLLLRALALRHIDVCTDNLDEVPARGENMMANCFNMFDGSIGEHDSEIDRVGSFLVQRLFSLVEHPASVAWMDPSAHGFAVRETLRRIKPPNSVTLLRPIENLCRSRI
jgi:hypothetical protein